MLSEDRRKQLDSIVNQMVSNKESDSNIQFVVNDFKQKYQQTETQTEKPEQSLTKKVTSGLDTVFGGGKAGEALGTEIARGTFGKTLQKVWTGQDLSPEASQSITQDVTKGQVLGSALQSASLFAPVGKIAGGITAALRGAGMKTAVSAIGKIGSGALTGGAFDVASNLQQGKTGADILTPSAGTAIGAGIPLAGVALSKVNNVVKSLASKTPTSQLEEITKSLSSVQKSFERESRIVTENGKRVVKSNPITTLAKGKYIPEVVNQKINVIPAKERISQDIDAIASVVREDIKKSGAVIDYNKLEKLLTDEISNNKQLKASGIVGKTLKQASERLKDFRESYGEAIPIDVIDDIRVAMNRIYDPAEYDVARAIGNASRKIIYDAVPTAKANLLREGELISASSFLDSLQGKAVKGGRLGGYFANMLGAIAGSSTQIPIVGPVVGAAGANLIQKKVAENYFKPLGSGLAQKVVKGESLVMNLLKKLIGNKGISPGDRLLNTKTGQKVEQGVKDYIKNPKMGLSMEDVTKSNPLTQEAKKFAEAGKDKYYFVRNTENKGGYINGKPSTKGSGQFNQKYEPTGEYMNIVSKRGYDSALPNLQKGTIEFKNPLVIETDGSPVWKKQLSEKYGGLTRDELSQTIKKDGYDGIITMNRGANNKLYPSEVVNLKTLKIDPSLINEAKTMSREEFISHNIFDKSSKYDSSQLDDIWNKAKNIKS